ncbi:MAG: hypothetical protein LBE83_05990 [Propionibacteriaceae bacterium]|jgi:hypothetical protein|nr:hypothetical protein [Propionibacteriaceae bacterium]
MTALYEFTIQLDRAPDDDDLDRLFEVGLDDTAPEIFADGSAVLHVMKRSESLPRAIVSAVVDIEKAGFVPIGIEAENLVTLADIAERTGRTRESVRLLSVGKRGPGDFPKPVTRAGVRSLYSWAAAREWFRRQYGDRAASLDDLATDTLAAADLLLKARLLVDVGELVDLVKPDCVPGDVGVALQSQTA